jgi:hypothetical protein
MMPWLNICSEAPSRAVTLAVSECAQSGVAAAAAAIPSITYHMWLTEEYAISFFRSVCAMATNAP